MPQRRAVAEPTFATIPYSESREWGYTGLLAFTAVLLLRPQDHFPVLAPLRLAELCAIVGIAPMLLHRFTRRLPMFRVTAEMIALGVFAAVVLATVPFSIWPGGATQVFFDAILKTIIVFALMMNTLTSPRRIRQMTWLILLCVGYIAAHAVFDYVRGQNLVEGGRLAGPVGGIFGNPNDLALNMVSFIPIAAVLAITSRQPVLLRLAAGVIFALMTATVVFTRSRSGTLGLIVMLITLILLTRRVRPSFGVAMVSIALLSGPFIPEGFWNRMASIWDETLDQREFTGSREARSTVMQEGLATFAERPFTGVGTGQFPNYNYPGRVERWRQTHNALLQVAAETGIIGLLAFSFLIYRGISTALWLRRQLGPRSPRDEPARAVRVLTGDERHLLHAHGIAMTASLVGWFTCAMFASVAYSWTFYYLLALTVSARELIRDRIALTDASDSVVPRRGRRHGVRSAASAATA